MSVQTTGLNTMLDGIGQLANLELVFTAIAVEVATVTISFPASVAGVTDIVSDISVSIPAGNTITNVYLRVVGQSLANSLVKETLSSPYVFVSAGNIIVKNFEMSVV